MHAGGADEAVTVYLQALNFMSAENINAVEAELSRKSGDRVVIIPLGLKMLRRGDPGGVLYQCDRRACDHCSGECRLTRDIFHAVNFSQTPGGAWIEVRGDPEPGEIGGDCHTSLQ